MRAHGVVGGVDGLGSSGHVCWTYDDARDFSRPALAWLADGLRLGQRLVYVSGRPVDWMRRHVSALPDVDDLLDRGVLRLVSLPDVYDLDAPLVPEEQLAIYRQATEEAVAAGFQGLRVLADVTDLVADPARRPAHLRWEHLADEFMAGHPLSAMCAYRRPVLGDEAITELTSVHPASNGTDAVSPFRLFFDDGTLVLGGSVDAFSSVLLGQLLDGSHVGPDTTLDVSGLDFIDARGVATLAEWAKRLGRVRVEGASPLFRRVWAVLGLDGLRNVRLAGESA
jgi:anti-anti-sigma regulatory factor